MKKSVSFSVAQKWAVVGCCVVLGSALGVEPFVFESFQSIFLGFSDQKKGCLIFCKLPLRRNETERGHVDVLRQRI